MDGYYDRSQGSYSANKCTYGSPINEVLRPVIFSKEKRSICGLSEIELCDINKDEKNKNKKRHKFKSQQ